MYIGTCCLEMLCLIAHNLRRHLPAKKGAWKLHRLTGVRGALCHDMRTRKL